MVRPSSSAARRGALAAVLALALSSLAVAPAVAASTSTPDLPTGVAECDVAPSAARAVDGKHGHDPNDVDLEYAQWVEALVAERLLQSGLAEVFELTEPFLRVTVPVHLHVITRDDGSGGPSPDQLDEQLAVLNTAFAGGTSAETAGTIFRFALESIDYTANTDWYEWSFTDTDDLEAKTALHRGDTEELNVYITGLQDALGYATFPFEDTGVLDGVVVFTESLPGGRQVGFNAGDTLVHEVGHWLGLFHTFENGCLSPGDGVADTPYQHDGENIVVCDELLNTCPDPGLDPVHNFMNYGDDPCIDRFSRGQSVRMGLSWYLFRR